jgi:hypothetical protein
MPETTLGRKSFTAGILLCAAAAAISLSCGGGTAEQTAAQPAAGEYMVSVVNDSAAGQVSVTVDGKAFTAWLYREGLFKPSLFPIITADGRRVTRGFPLELQPGDRVDHPHHVGAWFNYGNVNGVDFWGHSDSSDTSKGKFGVIAQRSIDKIESGQGVGRMDVSLDWLGPDGQAILKESCRLFFHADSGLRFIDRLSVLTPAAGKVDFPDTKEGMFAIRVARGLEEPSNEPLKYVDEHGKVTEVESADSAGANGEYLSSEGLLGEKQVWGTRAKWCILSGTLEGRPVSLAIFDHPDNVGYPTHWHARGYGLFSLNPLGWKDFSQGKESFNFSLEPGQNGAFRYRIVVSDERIDAARAESLYQNWLRDAGQEISLQ